MNELLSDYLYKYHIVYTDNYFTSLKLARYLLSTGTDLVETIRKRPEDFLVLIMSAFVMVIISK